MKKIATRQSPQEYFSTRLQVQPPETIQLPEPVLAVDPNIVLVIIGVVAVVGLIGLFAVIVGGQKCR